MLLRRITEHVKAQNWTAVALDFVIVVVGVFIGIQVSNWNDRNADRRAYDAALHRLEAEVATNLEMLEQNELSINQVLGAVRTAQAALTTCEDDPEVQQKVEAGVRALAATAGLRFRRNVIEELTETPQLLAQQSIAARKVFADLMFYTDYAEVEGRYSETMPLDNYPEKISAITLGTRETIEAEYLGIDFSKERIPLRLAAPISEACANPELKKSAMDLGKISIEYPCTDQKNAPGI